jgi:hypothetical protein
MPSDPRVLPINLLITGLRVSEFVSHNPTRKSQPLHPIVQLLQLGLFLFAADSATESSLRAQGGTQASSIA